MTNPRYSDISQYRDVESINYYKILQERGASKEEALAVLGERSRDNGRTPMQWKAGPNAGFTDGEPWIGIPENHSYINVEEENKDEDSILSCYKKLIRLRKEYRVIAEGDIGFIYRDHPQVLAYRRRTEEEELIVLANMTGREAALAPAFDAGGWELLTASWKEAPAQAEGEIRMLRPFESQVWRKSR